MDLNQENLKTLKDFEKLAVNHYFREDAKIYFSAGACSTETPRGNEQAFHKYRIQPRILRDVSDIKSSVEILRTIMPFPIGISPLGIQNLVKSDAECLVARACASEKCIFIMSCASTCQIETLYNYAPEDTRWMQLYIFKDRSLTLNLLRRAEKAKFSAIVVTVDSPVAGLWKRMMPENFGDKIKNRLVNLPSAVQGLLDDSLTFDDLSWLKTQTYLPIVVKGILSGEDAIEAVENGASAIFVSNHGERQIERVVSTIDCLEEVINAVRGTDTDVYLDGGVRSGADVFVALALGAKAVFIGRPAMWGLAIEGENGVRKILQVLKEEFINTMKLAGAPSIEHIKRSMVKIYDK